MAEDVFEDGFQGPGCPDQASPEVWTLDGRTVPWRAPEGLEGCADRGDLLEVIKWVESRGAAWVPEDPTGGASVCSSRVVQRRAGGCSKTPPLNPGGLVGDRPPALLSQGIPAEPAAEGLCTDRPSPGTLRAGVDWVNLSFRRPAGKPWSGMTTQDLVDWLAKSAREFFPYQVEPERGQWGSWRATVGFYLAPLQGRTGWDGRIQVKGSAFASMGHEPWLWWFRRLRQQGWTLRASRFDVAMDGDTAAGVLAPAKVRALIKQPSRCQFVTRARGRNVPDGVSRERFDWFQGSDGGSTVQIGQRGGTGQRLLRWYDKARQLRLPAEVELHRAELELAGRSADEAFSAWLALEPVGRIWASWIRGFVSFRTPGTGREMEWWSRLLGDAPAAKVGARAKSPDQKAIAHVATVQARAIDAGLNQVPKELRPQALYALHRKLIDESREVKPVRRRGAAYDAAVVDVLQDALELVA